MYNTLSMLPVVQDSIVPRCRSMGKCCDNWGLCCFGAFEDDLSGHARMIARDASAKYGTNSLDAGPLFGFLRIAYKDLKNNNIYLVDTLYKSK